ncbi:MAG TPA: hypothetical protein VGF12_08350 [Roseateles sp.]|uniref:DUF4870 family protein n=1 Tax=Roseateles sp. TaxID=1971397 RepID=UPI002ED8104F
MQEGSFDVRPVDGQQLQSLRQLTLAVYVLYAVGIFTGLPALIAIIINHVKYGDTVGTLYQSHFRWQIRSFWWGLVWACVGWATAVFGLGLVILALNWFWLVYRLVRGFLNWNDGKPMPV